jgi:hypothetical protein
MAVIDERLLSVNKHGAVAVPGTLWLAMAFLLRYWIVIVAVLVSVKRSPQTIRVLGEEFAWVMLAVEVPTALMMMAATNRRPDAWGLWRWLWTHGRTILIAIAAMHLAGAAFALYSAPAWRRWPELFIASCALLDAAVIFALARDDFFRQLFADFPKAAPAAGNP